MGDSCSVLMSKSMLWRLSWTGSGLSGQVTETWLAVEYLEAAVKRWHTEALVEVLWSLLPPLQEGEKKKKKKKLTEDSKKKKGSLKQ